MLTSLYAVLVFGAVAQAGEPTVTLSGMVVDGDGEPLVGATVVVAEGPPPSRFLKRVTGGAAPHSPKVLGAATSDDSGKFTLALLRQAPEVPWARTRLAVWSSHPDAMLAVRLIDRDWLAAGLPLSLALPRTAPARLKITDENWRPVAGARVLPQRVSGQAVPADLAERLAAETDADGRAMLAGVAPTELEAVRIEGEACGNQWFGLPGGVRDTIALLPLAPVGRLVGRLTADDRRAVRRRKLQFASWRIPSDEHAGGGLADVVTDDDGKFQIPAIAAGSLTFVLDEGNEPVYLTALTSGSQVDPSQTTTFEIPLRRAVTVIQEVRDRDDNTPIAGVRVSLHVAGRGNGASDASGRIRMHVLPAHVTPIPVGMPLPYYDPASGHRSVEIADNLEDVSLKPILLARGVPLLGHVVDENEHPLPGAEVVGFWSNQNDGGLVRACSNSVGEFTIEGVPARVEARLWASHGDATTLKPRWARAGGDPVTLVVSETLGVSLEGRVVDPSGRPVLGATVQIWASQRQFTNQQAGIPLGSLLVDGRDRLVTDADGWFRTPRSLRANAMYALEVEAPGMLPAETEDLEIDTCHTTRFTDVVLHPAPRLRIVSGRVVDGQGRAVAGATVWQSGDGPRRAESTTDEDGHFQLGDIYDGPSFVFARKDGFRLAGARVAADDKACEIALRRRDERAPAMKALKPPLPLDEERALAASLLEPMLPMLGQQAFTRVHHQLLRAAMHDPAKAIELADTIITIPFFVDTARRFAAVELAQTDLDRALTVIALLDGPSARGGICVTSWDRLSGLPSQRRNELLEEALRQAQAEPNEGFKANLLGRIGVRLLDAGQRERGTALVREGQALVEQLPGPNGNNRQNLAALRTRGWFAASLARIDLAAALRLFEGCGEPELCQFQADVAQALADHDPAESERIFEMIASSNTRSRLGPALLQRMAAADAERAARLARTLPDARTQAYALGLVAHVLAAADASAAARLLNEAFSTLEQAREREPVKRGDQNAALAAAALLPVAEKIDPALVEGYFWRALALREPRAALGDATPHHIIQLASLATMIARYDRVAARDLLSPLAGRLREALAEADAYLANTARPLLMALTVIDPHWAVELTQALPNGPDQLEQSPKQTATCLLAEWLGLSPADLWTHVYDACRLRDLDGREVVR